MIEKIKYIYEFQKYGFQRKTQLVSMLIMYVIGLVMEVVSHGTYWLGMFFYDDVTAFCDADPL